MRYFFSIYLFLLIAVVVFNGFGHRVVFNQTASLDIGWYLLSGSPVVQRGDIVALNIPPEYRSHYQDRRWLPSSSVPLLKRVVGVENDAICINDDRVFINGEIHGKVLNKDMDGLSLTVVSLCEELSHGMLYVANFDIDRSFDSRYFGPVMETTVLGVATPLWTWPA